jgi:hypothetical protein
MAISRQSVDRLATEIAFLYTSVPATNCLVVAAAVSAADSGHRVLECEVGLDAATLADLTGLLRQP